MTSKTSDVNDLFHRMGEKLGWFQHKDIDSAIKSLSHTGNKRTTKSRLSRKNQAGTKPGLQGPFEDRDEAGINTGKKKISHQSEQRDGRKAVYSQNRPVSGRKDGPEDIPVKRVPGNTNLATLLGLRADNSDDTCSSISSTDRSRGGNCRQARLVVCSSDSDSDHSAEEQFVSCIAESFDSCSQGQKGSLSPQRSEYHDDSVVNHSQSTSRFSPDLDLLGDPLVESTRIHRRSSVTYRKIMNTLDDSLEEQFVNDNKLTKLNQVSNKNNNIVTNGFDFPALQNNGNAVEKKRLLSVCEELENLNMAEATEKDCQQIQLETSSSSEPSLHLHLSLSQPSAPTLSQQLPVNQSSADTVTVKSKILGLCSKTSSQTDGSEEQTFTTCETELKNSSCPVQPALPGITESSSYSSGCLFDELEFMSTIGESQLQLKSDLSEEQNQISTIKESLRCELNSISRIGENVVEEEESHFMSTISDTAGISNPGSSASGGETLYSEEGDSYEVVDVSVQTDLVMLQSQQMFEGDHISDTEGQGHLDINQSVSEDDCDKTEDYDVPEDIGSSSFHSSVSSCSDTVPTEEKIDNVLSPSDSSYDSEDCSEDCSVYEVVDVGVQTEDIREDNSMFVSPTESLRNKIVGSPVDHEEYVACKYSPKCKSIDRVVKSPTSGRKMYSCTSPLSCDSTNLQSPGSSVGVSSSGRSEHEGKDLAETSNMSVDKQTEGSSLFSNITCNLADEYEKDKTESTGNGVSPFRRDQSPHLMRNSKGLSKHPSLQSPQTENCHRNNMSSRSVCHSPDTSSSMSVTESPQNVENSDHSSADSSSSCPSKVTQRTSPPRQCSDDSFHSAESEDVGNKKSPSSSSESQGNLFLPEGQRGLFSSVTDGRKTLSSAQNVSMYHDAVDHVDTSRLKKQSMAYDNKNESSSTTESSWRQRKRYDSSSSGEDDFDAYLQKLKQPAQKYCYSSSSPEEPKKKSMKDFIVEDDEMSSESDDNLFYIQHDMEHTPCSTRGKEARGQSNTRWSDDDDFSPYRYPKSVSKHKKQARSQQKSGAWSLSSDDDSNCENIPPKPKNTKAKKTTESQKPVSKHRLVSPGSLVSSSDDSSSAVKVRKGTGTSTKLQETPSVSGVQNNKPSHRPGRLQSKIELSSDSDDEEVFVPAVSRPRPKLTPASQLRNKDDQLFKQPTPLVTSTRNLSTPQVRTPAVVGFVSSLSSNMEEHRRHPDAKMYVTIFKKTKDELPGRLFHIFNTTVFDNQLPADLPIVWNKRLLKTAGYCSIKHKRSDPADRTAKIELSTKVCDTAERVRDTVIHELCHAAVGLINKVRDSHGPYWKYWARKANQAYPDMPVIARCHNYSVTTKYTYRCRDCGYSIGRHSKSLDTEKKVCGYCHGTFEIFTGTTPNASDPTATPKTPRTPNRFALYVKEHYSEVKKRDKNFKHGDVMRELSKMFSDMNSIS